MKTQIKIAFLSVAAAAASLLPTKADIIAYEGFNYGVGVSLSAQSQPAAFRAWNRSIIDSPGYTTISGSLAYTSGSALVTSGNAMTGGNVYQVCGMRINLAPSYDTANYNAAWDAYRVDIDNVYTVPYPGASTAVIGKDNTTLYVSFLMKSTSDEAHFGLYTDSLSAADPWGQMGVGTAVKVTSAGAVALMVGSYTAGTFDGVPNNGTAEGNHAIQDATATAVTAGSTNLYVLKIEFGAAGNGQDKVTLFVNPAVGGAEPGASNASITAAGNLVFCATGIYLGYDAGKGQFDELRFGSTWADVVPPLLTGFATWANSYGLPTDGTGDGAPDAILASDGITNLMKYALGIDPLVSGYQGRLSTSTINVSGSDYLSISYTRPDPAPTGITYAAEASAGLVTWSTAGIVETPGTPLDGLCTVSARYGTSVGSEARQFLRLKVVSP